MKLLWHSNAPWASTGYGNQTGLFAPRIRDAGYDTAVSAFYGLSGAKLRWEDMDVYPGGADSYGNDVLAGHACNHFGGALDTGLILTLVDAWVLDANRLKRARVGAWTPIDHEPAPPRVVQFFKDSDAVPIAMSRHGQDALKAHGLDPLYVPHGVDTNTFKPCERSDARKALDLPQDAYIVTMVAANKGYPSRKAFPEALRAFKTFADKHPEAFLYLHTEATGIIQGLNLPAVLASCQIPPERVRFAEQYQYFALGYPEADVANVYNASNVVVNPAYGEGFGIPILEAQACGTPVIVQDFTAMREVGETGWHVSGQEIWTNQGSWQRIPNMDQILWALEESFSDGDRKRDLARSHALQYDVDKVMSDHMLPALQELEARTEAPTGELKVEVLS